MVHMDEELDSSVQKVFVHNAVKLQLSESMCVNVMLINVVDVVVVRGEGYPCEAGLQLLVRNSTLDRLPSQMALLSKARGWIIVYVVVWACTLPPSMGYLSEMLRVGINAQFCEHKGATLLCDYKDTQRMVHMDEELDSSVQKVFVYNAVKLQLSESLCVNVVLNNVVDVVVVRGEGQPCEARLHLSTRNSTLDRLPSQVSYVHLEQSIFTSLATALSINQLIVINSTIKVLDISSTLQNGVTANLISSKIDTLEKLHARKGSELVLHKSSVHTISSHGLNIEGHVVLRESSINISLDESVVMFPGATLKLDSFSGNLAVKVESQELNDRPQVTKPSCEPCISIPDKSYWGAFITCLILLIIVSVFNIACIYMLKGKISRRDRGVKLSKKSSKTDLECSLIDGLINTSTQVTLVDIMSETFAIIPVRNLDEIYSKNMEISTSLLSDKSQYEEKLREIVKKINDCGSGKNNIHKIVNEGNKKLTKMGELEEKHKKVQEERSRRDDLVKLNTDKKMMRQQASEHMKKYVQKMRENAEQVLDLWNKMIVSFDWNTFMVDPQEWLRFFKCQIKEKENCLKVQTEQQNSNYKTNEEKLNHSVNERNEKLKQQFDCDISSIERDFDNEVRNASWKKETLKKLYDEKKETCKITYEVLKWKNLYVEPQKLKESHENALLSLGEEFLKETQDILQSILTMHKLTVLFAKHLKMKICWEEPESCNPEPSISGQKSPTENQPLLKTESDFSN
nr:uncharacterized protein LOC128696137 isoform X3 [Cherax quadricarinatus]XP_053643214.1 uncharacterized protein LOC128696137 isoform X3 [Cherax quadricarinatus]XP_053643216.1 uncharacterized protein LOC128696137 isoform X3 [Cherax quadricarinatus]